MSRLKYSSEKGSVLFMSRAMGLGRPWMTGERGSLSVMAKVPPGGGREGGREGGRGGGREGEREERGKKGQEDMRREE
jgi:hypothetical protein